MEERKYMERAIELAKKGAGFTNPNPMVGAVIVKDGRIIGEGYHEKCGELHAERNAIAALTESAKGAAIYVTLEPCCHHGKTPPCTDAIIQSGIAKAVIGSRDPNPLVAGKGVRILREAGIEVVEDYMRKECDEINPVFFHYITTKRPYVAMKYAMTADGKTATSTGKSKWITGEEAREGVQLMRHRYMGIMVGIGTVLADDPMLNVRLPGLKSPVRIICDSNMQIPPDSNILRTAGEIKTILVCAEESERKSDLEAAGATVVKCAGKDGRIDLDELMNILGSMGIDSILLEGGGTLNYSALKAGIVNEVQMFIAPKMFGGADAPSPVGGAGIDDTEEAVKLSFRSMDRVGEDIVIRYVIEEAE